ncbi:hypothetical protein Tco_0665690, partial [Tanacetum coccineum]
MVNDVVVNDVVVMDEVMELGVMNELVVGMWMRLDQQVCDGVQLVVLSL